MTYKSFNTNKRKINSLWQRTNETRFAIISGKFKRTVISNSITISQPITMGYNAPIDISDDFQTMAKDNTPTGNDLDWFISWQIIFSRIDIRLVQYFTTQIVYRVGNNAEGNSIDDPSFHPTRQTALVTTSGHINELLQEIDIPGETDPNIKTVIYNKSLQLRETLANPFPDFEVRLNAKFTNPHIYY